MQLIIYIILTHTAEKPFCHRHLKNSTTLGKLPLQHGTLSIHRVALKYSCHAQI